MNLPDLPGGWSWQKLSIVAVAATVVIAIGFLADTGPIQGTSGKVTFMRTDVDCAILIEIHTADMAAGSVNMVFFADADACYMNRNLSAMDAHGREAVSESIKAAVGHD